MHVGSESRPSSFGDTPVYIPLIAYNIHTSGVPIVACAVLHGGNAHRVCFRGAVVSRETAGRYRSAEAFQHFLDTRVLYEHLRRAAMYYLGVSER